MFEKKHIFILLLLIAGICAMSSVSAADNSSDVIASDDAALDEVATAIDEEVVATPLDEEVATTVVEEEIEGGEKLASSEGDSVVSMDQSSDVISYNPPSASSYDIDLESKYTISGLADNSIRFYLTPDTYMLDYAFDFYFKVYQSYTKSGTFKGLVYQSSELYSSSYDRSASYYTYTFAKGALPAGNFVLAAINYKDGKVMCTPATLVVNKNAVIISEDYNQYYNSGKTIPVRVIDQSTGLPAVGFAVKATFSNGVTKTYTTDSNGYASFIPPLGVGTYSVTLSSADGSINAPAVVKSVKIKKAAVKVKAKKIIEYKGFKTSLKATVTSSGQKVNEGTVTFKINGKSYKAKVKNGVAVKKINLKKLKTYKYTAKYNGNKNLKASKKVKGKATLKKRQKVKLIFKKPFAYMGQVKKVVVKIKSKGKYVKSGWLYVKHKNGVDKVKVKTGKVVLYAQGLASDHYKGTNGITTYYKKTVTRNFWMKYVPTAHKYKATKVKYKATSKYKCPTCGKTGSHNHYSYGYFVRYTYPIVVT